MAIELNKENFSKEVLESEGLVLVDFWAPWCGPCRVMGPVIDEVSEEVKEAKVCKLNIDNATEIATKYQVMSIPTLKVFKNGEVVNTSIGVISKEQVLAMLK